MRLIARGWRVRLAAGEQGRERWHLSIGLRRRLWTMMLSWREVRLVLLGLYLHWRRH